jgi:hypothetical protein
VGGGLMFKLKTDKELILELQRENKALKAENIELKEKSEANIIATKKMLRVDELTNEELIELKNIYPKWRDKEEFVLDEFVRHKDKLYKVLQAHTRQDDWTPNVATSLFTEIAPERGNTRMATADRGSRYL